MRSNQVRRYGVIAGAALVLGLLAVGVYYRQWRRAHKPRAAIPATRIAERTLHPEKSRFSPPVEDWPRWLGPRGDGISREAVGDTWPDGGPPQLWSAEVGLGYASPVAAAGR